MNSRKEHPFLIACALLLGVTLPLALAAGAVWFGFVKRDILYIGDNFWSIGEMREEFRGTAAVLTAIAMLGMALAFHGDMVWRRALGRRGCGAVMAAAGTLIFSGSHSPHSWRTRLWGDGASGKVWLVDRSSPIDQ